MPSENRTLDIAVAPAYLRKSRAEEGEELTEVLARHRAALDETAKRLGIVISEYYEEVVSGESLYARPEMLRLLEDVEAGKHRAVLCMDIDRLGRGGMRDQGIILDAFRLSDTLIITPDKIYDMSNDDDEELTEFKAFFARREYKMIRKRMARGMMRTIQDGGYIANAPYGYKKTKKGKLPSLEIVPEEARIVKYMFDRYLEGVGSSTISDEINAMGSKPNRSASWSRNSVRGVLQNPTYCGKVAWNRVKRHKKGQRTVAEHLPESEWLVYEGAHEAIITEDVYRQAQEIRKRRVVPSWGRQTGETKNPLAGLIKCSSCGRNMQRMGDNKGEPYILCNTKNCCAGAKSYLVEKAMLNSLQKKLAELRLELNAGTPGRAEGIIAAIEDVKKEIQRTEAKRAALYDYFEDGTYTKAEFAERRDKADNNLKTLGTRLDALSRELAAAAGEDMRRLAEKLEQVLDLYEGRDAGGRNMLLKSVVDVAFYTKRKKTKPGDFELDVQLLARIE